MIDGPLPKYRQRRRDGLIKPDMAQELAAEKLQSLHNALRHYEPAMGRGGWKARLGLATFQAEARFPTAAAHGRFVVPKGIVQALQLLGGKFLGHVGLDLAVPPALTIYRKRTVGHSKVLFWRKGLKR